MKVVQKSLNYEMGAIILKQANNDKGLNHKWPLFEHIDFSSKIFFEGFFGNMFLSKNIDKSPNKLHYLC